MTDLENRNKTYNLKFITNSVNKTITREQFNQNKNQSEPTPRPNKALLANPSPETPWEGGKTPPNYS
jgi:hypothetical protein